MIEYREHITIEPGTRSGKPCIKGTRITVYDILSYLASGMRYEEILSDFPQLTMNDILACLAYSADENKKHYIVAA
jgi:uncharacterized protein (DUF433 family)